MWGLLGIAAASLLKWQAAMAALLGAAACESMYRSTITVKSALRKPSTPNDTINHRYMAASLLDWPLFIAS